MADEADHYRREGNHDQKDAARESVQRHLERLHELEDWSTSRFSGLAKISTIQQEMIKEV